MKARWERVQELAEEVEKRADGEVWLKKVEADEELRQEVMGLVRALAAEEAVRMGPEARPVKAVRRDRRAAVLFVTAAVGGGLFWWWPRPQTETPGNVLGELGGKWPRLQKVERSTEGLLALEELETAMFELRGKVSEEEWLRLEVEAARRQAELGLKGAARARVERVMQEAVERKVESPRLRGEAAAVLKRVEN